ncbi:MAG TPA: plastocyanin/azurin family copper-binding protein [Chloroflexota bacterium]|nr:plastocyanin/azurin family copper-binding protein [Chloroflexota bacterium]
MTNKTNAAITGAVAVKTTAALIDGSCVEEKRSHQGWRNTFARFAASLALAGLPFVAASASVVRAEGTAVIPQAQTGWAVQVGGDDEANLAFTQAYFPGKLTVRAGDTVNFKFASAHTVTFNGGKETPALIVPGPRLGSLMLGPGFAPIGPQGPSIVYDSTQQISSGLPMGGPETGGPPSYSVTFAKPGLYGFVCTLHPGMHGEIEVLEAGAPLTETPAQATARGQQTLAALLGRIQQNVGDTRTTHVGTVHTAIAGLGDAFGVSAIRMIPGDLSVRRGDTVVWTNADPYEVHTIAFAPDGKVPEFVEPQPQPAGPPLMVIPESVASIVGGESFDGKSYTNSGLLQAGDTYALRFDAAPGTYDYLCIVHPFMKGTVTVTD